MLAPAFDQSKQEAGQPTSSATRPSRTSSLETSALSRATPGVVAWSWYTRSTRWMYRAGFESILGLRWRGSSFEMDPCIPSSWPEYGIVWRFGRTRYEISVVNPERRCRGVAEAELDGTPVDPSAIPLVDDGGTHHVRLLNLRFRLGVSSLSEAQRTAEFSINGFQVGLP